MNSGDPGDLITRQNFLELHKYLSAYSDILWKRSQLVLLYQRDRFILV
jgi:hypothetical protein